MIREILESIKMNESNDWKFEKHIKEMGGFAGLTYSSGHASVYILLRKEGGKGVIKIVINTDSKDLIKKLEKNGFKENENGYELDDAKNVSKYMNVLGFPEIKEDLMWEIVQYVL